MYNAIDRYDEIDEMSFYGIQDATDLKQKLKDEGQESSRQISQQSERVFVQDHLRRLRRVLWLEAVALNQQMPTPSHSNTPTACGSATSTMSQFMVTVGAYSFSRMVRR